MKGKRYCAGALVMLLACACERSHPRNSSGSNWLRCETRADCSAAENAVACENGYCVDADGERIAVARDGGRPPASGECGWGVDELLDAAGAPTERRGNCGNFNSAGRRERDVAVALECFSNAVAAGQAVELTLYNCIDGCTIPTYVASARGELFAVFMGQLAFTEGADVDVRVDACTSIELSEATLELVCVDPVELYACEERVDSPKEPLPAPPYWPIKLADVPVPPGDTAAPLHLYVSNQSSEYPQVDIDVYIDGTRVVTGDFDVEGGHNWFELEIEVPSGMRAVRALSREGGADLAQPIDVPAERWAVLDYWYAPGDAEGMRFTLSVHDQPVIFD